MQMMKMIQTVLFKRLGSLWLAVVAGLLLAAPALAVAGAFPPSEQILPATTRAWGSIAEPRQMRQRFHTSAMGRLLHEPLLSTFLDSLRGPHRSSERGQHTRFEITLEELEKMPGGEMALAVVEQPDGTLANLLLIDTTGHETESQAILQDVYRRLPARGATPLKAPASVTAFEVPPEPKSGLGAIAAQKPGRLAFGEGPSAVVIGDRPEAVAALLAALAKPAAEPLASLPAFAKVASRCGEGVAPGTLTARWFVDPLAYCLADQKTHLQQLRKKKGPDYVSLLSRNGFDAIKGIGGVVFYGEGNIDMRSNTLVVAAPGRGQAGQMPHERLEKAAKMLHFPNTDSIDPALWVPGDSSSWMALEWSIPNAFAAVAPIVDDIVGEQGVFDDVIASLKEDPDGPQIDVERDLIRHLGERVVVTGDFVTPFTSDCERMLIAIETSDPATVAATIAKSLASEGNTQKIEGNGHTIWESVKPEPGSAGALAVQGRGAGGDDAAGRRLAARGDALEQDAPWPNASVAVAQGHLFISSHRALLERVLGLAPGQEIAAEPDYLAAVNTLKGLLPGGVALRTFGRTDRMIQPSYEMLRSGRAPDSKSLVGWVVSRYLARSREKAAKEAGGKEGDAAAAAKNRWDDIAGESLPEFDLIRRYFGVAGMSMQSTPDGWYIVGASLWDGGDQKPAPVTP